MKKFIFKWWKEISFAIIAICVGVFLLSGSCSEKQNSELSQSINDKQLYNRGVDSMKLLINDLLIKQADSLLNVSDEKIYVLKNKTSKDKLKLEKEKVDKDSALARFKRNPDIENCKKTVSEQQDCISAQDSIIEDLGAEAEEYSNKNLAYEIKIKGLDGKLSVMNQKSVNDSTIIQDYKKQNTRLEKRSKFREGVLKVVIVAETVYLLIKSV